MTKSFRPPFSKGGAVEGAEPSSPVATGEIPLTAFLFVSFFFAPLFCKEKAAKKFIHFENCTFITGLVSRLKYPVGCLCVDKR
ncbi:MAG: hypothetical protein IJX13_07770 [Clostridia bacterium]|nr:hypothetical protein [Clostridia bacterium]